MKTTKSTRLFAVFFALISLFVTTNECKSIEKKNERIPIVIWHGMGDSCCFSFSIGAFIKELEETLPGIYVHSLRIGNDTIEDVMNGFFLHPDKQIEMACNLVKNDPELQNGFNAIGFSQGGQFLRALVQRCPDIKMKNLISLGGQHQGVYGLPRCIYPEFLCDGIRKLLNMGAYEKFVQEALVQATFWHDPLNEDKYKSHSTFLADINNEVEIKQEYKDRLDTLENFIMVKFNEDSMVQPRESEWFGFYKPGQSKEVLSMEETELYQSDRLPLRSMDENGKLKFLSINGEHLHTPWDWFVENIVFDYLN